MLIISPRFQTESLFSLFFSTKDPGSWNSVILFSQQNCFLKADFSRRKLAPRVFSSAWPSKLKLFCSLRKKNQLSHHELKVLPSRLLLPKYRLQLKGCFLARHDMLHVDALRLNKIRVCSFNTKCLVVPLKPQSRPNFGIQFWKSLFFPLLLFSAFFMSTLPPLLL